MDDADRKVHAVLSMGSEIAGAAVGGALGFLAGGPVGAAGAGIVGVAITRVVRDICDRYLSHRETIRIGAAAAIAVSLIKERLKEGDTLRDDGFFEVKGNRRSPAEEVFEGTLLAAKNTHEEKKAIYLGRLFANVSFNASCSADEANYLIHVTESLTYGQLVLLHLLSSEDYSNNLSHTAYPAGTQITYATLMLLHSIRELCNLNLVIMQGPQDAHHTIVLEINTICPAHLRLTVGGQRLHSLLGLAAIPTEDLDAVAQSLR